MLKKPSRSNNSVTKNDTVRKITWNKKGVWYSIVISVSEIKRHADWKFENRFCYKKKLKMYLIEDTANKIQFC